MGRLFLMRGIETQIAFEWKNRTIVEGEKEKPDFRPQNCCDHSDFLARFLEGRF